MKEETPLLTTRCHSLEVEAETSKSVDKPLCSKNWCKHDKGLVLRGCKRSHLLCACFGITTVVLTILTGVLIYDYSTSLVSKDTSFPQECKILPKDFKWGVATASYQVEGGAKEGGRSDSIWDVFSHIPGKVARGDTGDVACDQYHRYKEDVGLMKTMGVKFYRLSISWSRLVPGGVKGSEVNSEGLKYYSDLVDALMDNGITPMVTLYHWDLPAVLEDPKNSSAGWLDPAVVDHFEWYAEVAFRGLGDRVKQWITFNEPWVFCKLGYEWGGHAPGKAGLNPYLCGHHVLLAHARAARMYEEKFAEAQAGRVGITLNSGWSEPWTGTHADIQAAERSQLFELGWFADPLWKGDYPPVMKERLGETLPTFTDEEKTLINGSSSFFGLNHYTTNYVSNNPLPGKTDPIAIISHVRDKWGKQIGPQAESWWLRVVPWGFRKLLTWVHHRYDGPEIWVTENGVSVPKESDLSLEKALEDTFRVGYYRGYLKEMCNAIAKEGVKLGGYTAWSLMDNFEWADGFYVRFGLHYVDFKGDLTRHPKASAKWLSRFFTNFTGTTTTQGGL